MDTEVKAIISNYHLRLASNDINSVTLNKFILETFNKIQQIFALFLLSLFKIAARTENCCAI